MFKEFKEFALKGNMLDMAVGIIIGAAFGKIVSSLVADLITPLISLLLGKVNFTNLFVSLSGQTYPTLKAAQEAGALTLNYGIFLQAVFDFLVVAFAIFIVIRQMNRLRRQPAPAPAEPTTKECPFCWSNIPIKATRCAHCTSQLVSA